VAFWKAWILIQDVTASRPAIMSRGRCPIRLTNPKASKNAMWSMLDALGDTLAAHHGTAGILRDQAPPPLDGWAGVDAVVVSTENALS
jgi:hypothetical protein